MTGWLTGWKQISRYIGRCVDTAKLYYKQYGMPVLRDPSETPVAIPEQLDSWLHEFNRLTANEDEKEFAEYKNQASRPG